MKTIIAGGRDFTDYELVKESMAQFLEGPPFVISEVVSGGATGADSLGERWAKDNEIPVRVFPADWARFHRGAGPIRNAEMAEYADALIVFWDGKSRGTKNMLSTAKKQGLVWIGIVRTDKEGTYSAYSSNGIG